MAIVENAMVVGTTLEVVVKTKDRREMMQAQATQVVPNIGVVAVAVAVVVAEATMLVANMAAAVVAVAVEHLCLMS